MAESPHQQAPVEAWHRSRRWEEILRPLLGQACLSKAVVEDARRQMGIGRSYFYQLLAAYRQRPQTSTLLPRPDGGVQGGFRLPDGIELLVGKCIENFYMSPVRPSFAALVRTISHECQRRELPVPNYRTIQRRVAAYDPKQLLTARFGTKAANETFRPVQANHPPAFPFQLLQIDHTRVDVIVVDERDRLPIGRPWITLAVDVATRVVTGFYLSLDSPSVISVALVLTQSVLPKETWLAERGITSVEWPISGIPDTVHLDNAEEFHAHALVRGAQEYGIELEYRPLGQPHYGGHIERLIGTTMGAVHLLPGTTFSNVQEKGSYDSEKHSAMTMAELERWLALEILGRYHLSIHSALRMPPLAAWKKGMQARGLLRQVTNAKEFFCDFLPAERRIIRRDGIRLFNIHYWDNVLSPLAGRSSKPALVKYDPRDLSRIYVRDERGQYWDIPYRDLRLPPIALWEHRAATKQLRAEGQRMVDEKAIFEVVEEQRALAEDSQKSTRERRAAEKRRRMPGLLLVDPPTLEEEPRTQPSMNKESVMPFEVEEWE